MVKRQRTNEDGDSPRKKISTSRIGRACDRCQHRKLACDPTEHSCQQCQKANTWCTITDNLSGIPAYRGQYEYLERRIERQHEEIQDLLHRLKSVGQNVAAFDLQDSEMIRYTAWKQARSLDPNRPWEREDKQANRTRDLVLRDGSQGSPRSHQSSIQAYALPSPELTPHGVFDFLTQPTRSQRSCSIYSAPSQLPSSTPHISVRPQGYRPHNSNSYDQPISTNSLESHQVPSIMRGPFLYDETTNPNFPIINADNRHFIPHSEAAVGPVYGPDGSTWYSYTTGLQDIQDYTATQPRISQDSSGYTMTSTANYYSSIPAQHGFPVVVIDSHSRT